MSEDKFNEISISDLQDHGYLMEANRQFFHPLGLAMFVSEAGIGIYDWRDDPEGVVFASLADDGDMDKFDRVAKELDEKSAVRVERFGWVVQPMGTRFDGD